MTNSYRSAMPMGSEVRVTGAGKSPLSVPICCTGMSTLGSGLASLPGRTSSRANRRATDGLRTRNRYL
jgi:hypothetical protein